MFQLLRSNKKFSMLVVSSVLSQFGSFFSYMLFIVLMYKTTNPILGTMGIALSASIGSLLAGVVAGVFVDRIKPTTILVWGNVCSGIILTTLFFLPHLTVVYFISVFLVAISNTFSGSAFTKLQLSLVEKEDLLASNGALQSTRELTKIFAPGAAAFVIGFLPLDWKSLAFLVDASSYFLSVFIMLYIMKGLHYKQPQVAETKKKSFFADWKEGISTFSNPVLTSILILFLFIIMWIGAVDILLAARIHNLKMPTEYIGYSITSLSIGSIITVFLAPKLLKPVRNGMRIGGAACAIGICLGMLGLSQSMYGIFISMFFLGCSTAVYNITSPTYFQENIPEQKIGRAFGFITSAMSIVSVLGLSSSGILSSFSSPEFILKIIGCIVAIYGFCSIFIISFYERKQTNTTKVESLSS